MIHTEPHPLAGQTVTVTFRTYYPVAVRTAEFKVEDWWDRVAGKSWMNSDGNPAALLYAVRSADENLPLDDAVVYGKIGWQGVLFHISEIADPA
jgi:hypothetical protein